MGHKPSGQEPYHSPSARPTSMRGCRCRPRHSTSRNYRRTHGQSSGVRRCAHFPILPSRGLMPQSPGAGLALLHPSGRQDMDTVRSQQSQQHRSRRLCCPEGTCHRDRVNAHSHYTSHRSRSDQRDCNISGPNHCTGHSLLSSQGF